MLCNVMYTGTTATKGNKRKQKNKNGKSDIFNFFKKVWGYFLGPKALSFFPPVRVPDFLEVTFDRFFPGPQNGPKLSKKGF